jgi:hypothetical protein
MSLLEVTAQIAEVGAAISAVALARRRPAHAPAAVALTMLAAVPLLDGPIVGALTPPSVEPWQGWHRVLVYFDGALNLSTIAATTGLAVAVAVTPERRRRVVAIVGAVWLLKGREE